MAGSTSARDVDRRLRAGALAFGLAALMWVPSLFSVHPPSNPAQNREFALGANTASYRLATSLQIYALTPVILGMFALYAILARSAARRLSIVGLVLTVAGAGLLLPGTGFAAFVMPAAGVLISQGLSSWAAVLLALAALVGLPTFLDVVALARIGAALFIAAFIALAIDIWRNA